ncbi:MAG TPA: hypothetical protein VKP30_13835 [Polyangiaceae bacterium]|nr:hypothetical protein [Polyangiaceae bacterium]
MNHDNPIDFSTLDPARSPLRWQARIDQIVDATMRARRQRESLPASLLHYARPALAIAAAVALVSWVGAMQSRASATTTGAENSSSTTVLEWASNDQVPSTSEVLDSLGTP